MESTASYHSEGEGGFSALPRVELHIACTDLANLDTFSKSDPQVFMYVRDASGQWREHGKTEMIKDTLNPKFVQSIIIDYHFEETQQLRFVCVDIDHEGVRNIEKHDYIGEIQCKLAEIVTAPNGRFERELRDARHPNSRRGKIIIQFEEVHDLNFMAHFQFHGVKLDKKDLFGKSDPFLVISRVREQGAYVPVYKTEVIKKTLDPVWNPFSVSVQRLCNGDYERPLMIECFDWNRSGKHELIGQFKTNLRKLTDGSEKEFVLIHPELKQKKKNYKNSGVIKLIRGEIEKIHSFLDYISGGCEINLFVAIDFTASNGNPAFPQSLHYNSPYEPNEYVRAITAVGEILTEYDSDKLFPVYGFGAKLPPHGQVSHCFPLNGNFSNPEVYGLHGILDAYRAALSAVTLYGPTIFSQILRTVAQSITHCTQEQQKYSILLILTDGVIDDMEATIDEIVKNNDLPLSIVIVGIGTADFKNMNILDADDSPLTSSWGEVARRDIVQFVPFRDFKSSPPARLAKELLEEIPRQLLSYMKLRRLNPNPVRVGISAHDPLRTQTFTTPPVPGYVSMSVQQTPMGGGSVGTSSGAFPQGVCSHHSAAPPISPQGSYQPPPPNNSSVSVQGLRPAPSHGPAPSGVPSAPPGAPMSLEQQQQLQMQIEALQMQLQQQRLAAGSGYIPQYAPPQQQPQPSYGSQQLQQQPPPYGSQSQQQPQQPQPSYGSQQLQQPPPSYGSQPQQQPGVPPRW